MKPAMLTLWLFAALVNVRADVYNEAKAQARRATNQTSAAGNQPQLPQGNQPLDPVLAATLANIASLRADFAALADSAATKLDSDERMALLNHLSTAAQGAKPSAAAIQKLAGDLETTLLGKPAQPAQQAKLARAVHALFNGSHLGGPQQSAILADVKKVLADAGIAAGNQENVLADLQAIAAETK